MYHILPCNYNVNQVAHFSWFCYICFVKRFTVVSYRSFYMQNLKYKHFCKANYWTAISYIMHSTTAIKLWEYIKCFIWIICAENKEFPFLIVTNGLGDVRALSATSNCYTHCHKAQNYRIQKRYSREGLLLPTAQCRDKKPQVEEVFIKVQQWFINSREWGAMDSHWVLHVHWWYSAFKLHRSASGNLSHSH